MGHWYSMFGFDVASDFRLPLPEKAPPIGKAPDWCFRRAAEEGCQSGLEEPLAVGGSDRERAQAIVRRGESGAWIQYPGVGTFHVPPDARRVDVYVEPETDEQVLGLTLGGQISVFVLHQLGYPTLHASAVVTEHGAVAFLGRWGQGKSTMTAAFIRRGATLLTDDILPLRPSENGILVGPGLPIMKLWPEAARRALGLPVELPNVIPDGLVPGYDKKLVAIDGVHDYARQPQRLAALYVLQRYAPDQAGTYDVTIQRLPGQQGLIATLEHVSQGAFLEPTEIGRLLPVYVRAVKQAPVRLLRYPTGFEYQDALCGLVLRDLSESRASGGDVSAT